MIAAARRALWEALIANAVLPLAEADRLTARALELARQALNERKDGA